MMLASRALGFLIGASIAISDRAVLCQANSAPPSAAGPSMIAPSRQMPAYEVATIKPWDGKGFAMPILVYIQVAFGISPNRTGWVIGPDWLANTRYVIQAKPPDSIRDAMQNMTPGEREKENEGMMQSLLRDRFKLKAHFETREMPVYQLVLARGGPKLKENPDSTKGRAMLGSSAIRGPAAPIRALIGMLESVPDIGRRAVIDKTGLTGTYDFWLKFSPMDSAPGAESGVAASPDPAGASLFTAIEEQLGLKLQPAKEPGQVLVVDHIEQPSEN